MKLLTLRQLEELTGKHRKFLNELLEGIAFMPGANSAHLYESTKALAAIYAGAKSLEEARIQQAETAAHLDRIRAETLSKTRIPIDLVLSITDQVLQSMCATLKAAKGETLTLEKINEILADFRSIPRSCAGRTAARLACCRRLKNTKWPKTSPGETATLFCSFAQDALLALSP